MEFGLPAPFPGVPSIVCDILSRQPSPYISPQVSTFSLGQAYDESMCEYINKYLELDTNDRLCYVGIDQGTLVPVLRRCFVLTEPVTEVNPSQGCVGVVDRHGTREEMMNKVSVEEFFRQEATKPVTIFLFLISLQCVYVAYSSISYTVVIYIYIFLFTQSVDIYIRSFINIFKTRFLHKSYCILMQFNICRMNE